MSAAIHFEGDAFLIPTDKPMGRNFAGHGFLSAYVQHAKTDRPVAFVRDAADGLVSQKALRSIRQDCNPSFITPAEAGRLKDVGCLFTPSIPSAAQAWLRNVFGERAWSLCGVNHTLSSNRAMDGVAALPALPFRPWDALICTSRASRAVVQVLLERQMEFLRNHLGASRFHLPRLPVIPLGVDCEAQATRMERREEARASLGLSPGEIVVLFVGRLSFHAKANPMPMYMALERLARTHQVTLIECGWASNEAIEMAFADARAKLCPSVRSIRTDGRREPDRTNSWAAADIFCSLTDNIQETFGLTPIEAMAAGLPVVVTDWDGYKDTVRHGIDGFAVPTLMPPPGSGLDPMLRHALELDTYDAYIGHVSTTAVVDVDAAALAFEHLADPATRNRMGQAGAARARQVFDWRVVIGAYERLWEELRELRQAEPDLVPDLLRLRRGWAARPDPFELFASFPSGMLSGTHRVQQRRGIDAAEVEDRLSLKTALVAVFPEVDEAKLLALWQEIGPDETDVSTFLNGQRIVPGTAGIRALLLLAKLDLIRIAKP